MKRSDDCDAFIAHMRLEHEQMQQRILSVRRNVNAASLPNRWAAVADELVLLREFLTQHFQAEEAGGLLDEAVGRCPALGSQADACVEEHAGLLGSLEGLLAAARSGVAASAPAFRRQADRFLDDLAKHEAAELEMLEYGFGVSVEDHAMPSTNPKP